MRPRIPLRLPWPSYGIVPRCSAPLYRTQAPASRSYATAAPEALQKLLIGQPTFETHPHLLKKGELTRGITSIEYATRRAKLASHLPDGGVAILAASTIKYRSGPVFYEFHQDPDFFYLSGFNEPDAVCVVEKTGPDGQHNFHLFVRPKDEKAEQWEGSRCGVDGARHIFNADNSGSINRIAELLAPIIDKSKIVYTDIQVKPRASSSIFSQFFTKSTSGNFGSLVEKKSSKALKQTMHRLRINKSPAEVANMRKAGRISGRAFNETIERRFNLESDLWAYIEYQFRLGGCEKAAYVPVVACGKNALKIHYTRNDDKLRDGELVLVDAGGQYGGYVADITRTWPVNGKFTDPQRDLYQAILEVQKKCVALCREDKKMSLDDIHSVAEDGLVSGLKNIGFDVTHSTLNSVLFPHHLGHYVGLDIHDSGSYGRSAMLKTGQCVTIEPGIYVPNDERWPKHFRNMGIRIEDSICVSEEGPINLSVNAAKEICDLEGLAEQEIPESQGQLSVKW